MNEEQSQQETKVTLQDIHLVAFLSYHKIPYEMKTIDKRVSFLFTDPRAETVMAKFHVERDAGGQVFVGKYVEILKTVRREMYQEKEKN